MTISYTYSVLEGGILSSDKQDIGPHSVQLNGGKLSAILEGLDKGLGEDFIIRRLMNG
jgi:hypothetical protein